MDARQQRPGRSPPIQYGQVNESLALCKLIAMGTTFSRQVGSRELRVRVRIPLVGLLRLLVLLRLLPRRRDSACKRHQLDSSDAQG